jgi:membrane-associated phospholipid phosphatase
MKLFFSFLLLIMVLLLKSQPVFEFTPQKDYTLLGGGIAFSVGSIVTEKRATPLSVYELPQLTTDRIPSFDKRATKNWSPTAARISDIGLLMCVGSPVLLLLSSEARGEAGIVTLMGAETLLLTSSLTLFTKNITARKRPYVYNSDLSDELRTGKDSKKSFFSGHTSLAFASVVFTSSVFSEYYPNSKAKPFVWASGLALAGSVGYLRYRAGKHFPSDILAGAVVGSAVGFFVPRIHRFKTKQSSSKTAFTVRFVVAL